MTWKTGWVQRCKRDWSEQFRVIMVSRMLKGSKEYNVTDWAANRIPVDEAIEELSDCANYLHAIKEERDYHLQLLKECYDAHVMQPKLREKIEDALGIGD